MQIIGFEQYLYTEVDHLIDATNRTFGTHPELIKSTLLTIVAGIIQRDSAKKHLPDTSMTKLISEFQSSIPRSAIKFNNSYLLEKRTPTRKSVKSTPIDGRTTQMTESQIMPVYSDYSLETNDPRTRYNTLLRQA